MTLNVIKPLTPPAPPTSSTKLNASKPRASKRLRQYETRTQELQEHEVESNNLRKYIERDVKLLHKLGWHECVRQRRSKSDFGSLNIQHPAQRLLRYLSSKGAPIVLTTAPWDTTRIYAAAVRGPHKSAYEHQAFLRDEMAEMILRQQWIVLPYEDIKNLPGL